MTKTSGPATSMNPRANTVSGKTELGSWDGAFTKSDLEFILAISEIPSHTLEFFR